MAGVRSDKTNLSPQIQEMDRLEQLFACLAEDLKLPIEQIARRAELALASGNSASLSTIQTTADMTLQLLDNYLLALRLLQNPQARFMVEPVSVAAVLHDARQQLAAMARQYRIALDLEVTARYEPVLAHPLALRSALISVGHAFIEALPAMDGEPKLHLAAHRTKYGIVAGLYCDAEALTPQALRRGHELHGQARQPLVSVLPGSGAGVFVAEAIMQAMSSRLRVGRHRKLLGFAVTLPPSPQLQLV